MALFARLIQRMHSKDTGQLVLVERRKPRLPLYFRHLHVHCHNPLHGLAVRMRFSHWGASRDGQPLAVYECSHPCRCQQAWTRHRATGEPFRLWAR